MVLKQLHELYNRCIVAGGYKHETVWVKPDARIWKSNKHKL